MRHTPLLILTALLAGAMLTGCKEQQVATQYGSSGGSAPIRPAALNLPSGTPIEITLTTPITSETASVGEAWSGSVRNAVMLNGRNVVPAGSPVTGTVTAVTAARRGDRALLDLQLASVTVNDHRYSVRGSMESVVAGSPRARNLGAIGASTVAGAVIGHAVGGSRTGTVVGGIIGAGAASAAVSQTRGWQVVLKPGTPLTFTTNEALAVRP
jgi:hypothetical protein